MHCPYCNHEETKVIDSREVVDSNSIKRRRECVRCEKRFSTKENVQSLDIEVIKKDGKREEFSREKIKRGMIIACQKRPVSDEQLEQALNRIEFTIKNAHSTEVPSSLIGQEVMKELKKLDKVAFIRFASVYKEFKDLEEFNEQLQKLISPIKTK